MVSPILGLLSVILGLVGFITLDTASRATIVLVSLGIFLLVLFASEWGE